IRGRSPQRADALDFSARQEQAELARSGAQNYVKADPSFAGAGLAESLLRSEVLDTARVSSDAGRVEQGPLRARWLGDGELALLRTVRLEQGEITQGVWLDWSALRVWLQSQVQDLLPEAQLVA